MSWVQISSCVHSFLPSVLKRHSTNSINTALNLLKVISMSIIIHYINKFLNWEKIKSENSAALYDKVSRGSWVWKHQREEERTERRRKDLFYNETFPIKNCLRSWGFSLLLPYHFCADGATLYGFRKIRPMLEMKRPAGSPHVDTGGFCPPEAVLCEFCAISARRNRAQLRNTFRGPSKFLH